MDAICESCGVANPAGTEFCLFCGTYIAWERSVLVAPGSMPPPATASPQPATVRAAPPGPPPTPVEAYRPGVAAPAPPVQPPPPPAPPRPVAPTPQAGPGWPDTPAAAPTQPLPAYGSPGACSTCGRVNDPSLRFCAKCGQILGGGPGQPGAGGVDGATPSRWSQTALARDRAARKAYRRSLPALYRWRRVLIGLLVVALGVGGLYAVGRHPVRWTVDRYYDLRGTTVVVPGVQAAADPVDATVPGSSATALTDLTEAGWTMNWKPTAQGASCGGAPGTGVAVLTMPRTRVRQIDIEAGLLAKNAERPLQFRPESIGISFDGGPCHSFPLPDTAARQHLVVDSGVPVTTIRIGVDTAYAARPDGQPLLSITEILVRSRPSG